MIAALYCRKSTDDSDRNAEARSTRRQIESATAYAERKGWTVDPRWIFLDENTSGAEWKHRPGFNALLAALEGAGRPPFDVVIVSELSRIGRDTVRTPAAVMRIEEAGVEIRSYLSDAPISLADETSEIHTIFNSLAASFERRRARQRTYDALRRRAEAGAVTGGRVFGYRNERNGSGYVHRVIDETEAAIVRRIFTLYAEGDGLTRIAKRLNADGVPAARSGTGSWAPTAVREILRRDLYRGRVVWNKSQKVTRQGTRGQRQRPATEWLEREAQALRIVSEPLWEAVERRRRRAATMHASLTRDGRRCSRPPGSDLRSPSLLGGLAQCAVCGGSLTSMTRPYGSAGHRRRVAVYGCSYHRNRGPAVCSNRVVIRQERLDSAVLAAVAEALDERALAPLVARAIERAERRGAEAPERRQALERERAAIATAVRHLLDAIKHGQATETLLGELAGQEARAKAIERELAAFEPGPRLVALDRKQLAALARVLRGELAAGPQRVRCFIQRALGNGRLACVPFREPGRRGYRFQATGRYAALLSPDSPNIGGPNGTRSNLQNSSARFHCALMT